MHGDEERLQFRGPSLSLSLLTGISRVQDRWLTCDAGVQLQQRVEQHTLVELAHVVVLVPPASIEAPGAAASSFARWPATGRTRAPGWTAARGQHPHLGRLAHRQLVLGELVLARRLRRAGHAMMMTMMIVMMMQAVTGVQLALLVRLRMVPCGDQRDTIGKQSRRVACTGKFSGRNRGTDCFLFRGEFFSLYKILSGSKLRIVSSGEGEGRGAAGRKIDPKREKRNDGQISPDSRIDSLLIFCSESFWLTKSRVLCPIFFTHRCCDYYVDVFFPCCHTHVRAGLSWKSGDVTIPAKTVLYIYDIVYITEGYRNLRLRPYRCYPRRHSSSISGHGITDFTLSSASLIVRRVSRELLQDFLLQLGLKCNLLSILLFRLFPFGRLARSIVIDPVLRMQEPSQEKSRDSHVKITIDLDRSFGRKGKKLSHIRTPMC